MNGKFILIERGETVSPPSIDWVRNDPEQHQLFSDGSIFLVALQTGKSGGPYTWDFDVVKANCDEDGMTLVDREGNSYDAWSWDDFEFFKLLEGDMPTRAE